MTNAGQRIREKRAEINLTQKEVARLVGVTKGAVSQWETGQTKNLEGNNLVRLAKVLKTSPGYILDGTLSVEEQADNYQSMPLFSRRSDDPKSRRLPIVGTAQLGDDGYWYELDTPVGNGDGYVIGSTADDNAYALRVRGDSMHPSIRDGWIVVVEPNSSPIPGQFVLVATTDGRKMVKEYLFDTGDTIGLQSVNDRHPRLTLQKTAIEKIHYVAGILPPGKIEFD